MLTDRVVLCLFNFNHFQKILVTIQQTKSLQIIFYWQDIATVIPKNKNEVLSQPIWNNRFLTVNKEMVFFLLGIKQE